MKKIISDHKIIIIICLFLTLIGYIINAFIPKNTITLLGEYIFSFDYLGHIRNILFDKRSLLAMDNTNCFDCVDFFHYSRWYSLFKISYQAISQLINLRPAVFLILSATITQLLSLYVFTKVFFKKISWIPFIVAAFIFIWNPYKYSLLVETHDGVMYSNLLLYFTALIYSIKNLTNLKTKELIALSVITGLLFSFFLNISVAFFPIIPYITIGIFAFYYKNILSNIKKSIFYSASIILIAIVTNIPFIQSIITNGASRHYFGYLSYGWIDSTLAGLQIAQANTITIFIFAILLISFFFYAPMSKRNKTILLVIYLLTTIMILGSNSPINIYEFIFKTFPLMDSFQATHRFMFFDFVIFFIITYLSLERLFNGQKIKKALFYGICIILISLTSYYIIINRNYFYVSYLPTQYFQAQKYLNTLSGDKIYFPPTTKLFHDLTIDYTWSRPGYNKSIILYKNPFTSLVPIKNLISFERFPYLLSNRYLELFYLTNLNLPQQDILKAMELRGIEYVIVDKNFKWSENYPDFNVNEFIKRAQIIKRFGSIYILKLPNLSSSCLSGYGKITLNYCTDYNHPKVLLDKTPEEFKLEVFSNKFGKELTVRRDSIYIKNILDPLIHQELISNRILFGRDIMQMYGDQNKVFSSYKLKRGTYILHVSLFKYNQAEQIMGNANVVVKLNTKIIKSISSYAKISGIYWDNITINVKNDGEQIYIDINGEKTGYVIFGQTPILTDK